MTSTTQSQAGAPHAPGDSVPGRSAPIHSDASAAEATESIAVLRGQIDSLDEAIVNLVAERTKLSARIQTARINGGGTRVELGRERVIRDAYRTALGQHGPALAEAVLQVGRGRR